MSERVWRAQPRQREFLRRTEDEVLYGGAAGGGKTDALLIHGIRVCCRHARARVLFLRRTFADLNKPGAAIDRSRALLTGAADWHGDTHRWTFGNGSFLQFGHLQHPGDIYSYQGSQLDALLWDELTQFDEAQYDYLRMRVRATVEGLTPTIRAATNPGGVGHGWVKRRWITAAPWGEPFTRTEPGGLTTSLCFVPAKVDDNQELLRRDPQYKARMAGLPEALRRAYLDGDWDVFIGQFFHEWRRETHVCRPIPIPAHWVRWLGIDYGYGAPMACYWLARDPASRRIYVYRELYGAGLRDEQQAARVLALSKGERILLRFADPSMFAKRAEHGQASIADIYGQARVTLTPAANDRRSGWQVVRRALAGEPPRLQVFETCTELIRTLPEQVYDPLDAEDLADTVNGIKTEDHAVDALRYALMGEAVPAHEIKPASITLGYGRNDGPHARTALTKRVAQQREEQRRNGR